jgi:putative serine protease PepD
MSDEHVRVPQEYSRPPYYGQEGPPPPTQPPSHGWSGGAIVAAAVAGAVIGGILVSAAMLLLFGLPLTQQGGSTSSTSILSPRNNEPSTEVTSEANQPVEAVAAKVTPSVVYIAITTNGGFDPFTGQSFQSSGNGSGVVIRQDGYILTNNHVVSGATSIKAQIGLTQYDAKVVGTDPTSDIAVIKIAKTGLTPATLGNSNSVQVGETVVAIGSPFGLNGSVTAGIVSALHRSGSAVDQQSQTTYSNLIQTDAPINPGNSGGALCDLAGNVVGINTLIQSTTGSSAGIGFAIPINLAKQIAEQLMTTGKATHTFLGVATVDVSPSNASQLGVQTGSGALVDNVQSGSPAAKAGLKRGDIITKVGDAQIQTSVDLIAAVRAHNPGDSVAIVVTRAGKTLTLTAVLGSSG